ncbi:NLP/P60 protein [Catenulispora acidiphila DSM 44928]|uniref:NLP/P60 protein n=1 Tax=Catenulispora acidiphila (strain DSM 44928 / JCM 14897 / NBRC 102108 / NRRL B-24433 / ID139908) TaxID=479433 RepID=C7QKL7_CATAD|nr:NlpC/P60 family protein [Catenulispora acidiphila]ACU77116.1 NLP/P60 protein [Catenulispora acidiphila DSM 44928]
MKTSIIVGASLVATPFLLVGAIVLGTMSVASGSSSLGTVGRIAEGTVPSADAALMEQYGHMCPTLTPSLLAAQLYQESGFDPAIVSPAGAIGIAQFMPGTWPNWSSPQDGDGKQDPRNPADAIPAAARYDCAISRQLSGIGGDAVANMLAGYNAGPGAVEQYRGIPPYSETQNYVKNIEALEQAFRAPDPALAPSDMAVRAIAYAYDRLNTPYEWGGDGTDGRFDCSGLVQAAYTSVGITMPRTASEQWYTGPHVPVDRLQPGDLVFYATDLSNPGSIHHVGIYVGGGVMIDAPHTGAVIRFDPIGAADYLGATRPQPLVVGAAVDAATPQAKRTASNPAGTSQNPGTPAPTTPTPTGNQAPAVAPKAATSSKH